MVAAQRGVERAAKEHFLGHSVDQGDRHDQQKRPVMGKLKHTDDQSRDRRDLPGDQPAGNEDTAD